MRKRLFIKLILFFLVIIIVIGYLLLGKIFIPLKGDFNNHFAEVKIRQGLSLSAIADSLDSKNLIKDADDFIFACKLFRNHNKLKAGRYQIRHGLSIYQIMNIIVKGKTSNIKVTVPEGYTSFEIASLLSKKVEIDSSKFITLVHNPEFIQQFNINASSLEGYLFPNTYYFFWGISEKEIIKVMVHDFFRHVNDSLRAVITEKGWTMHQILTLASLIEGEVMVDSERAIVSAIYHNRLKRGMLLQSCPTVQYIIPDGPRRLLKKDLEIDSRYNTYVYPGLPPGPVNNPGMPSIIAAINPAKVDYLYLVARGDGTHIFSKTLSNHLKAKKKFDEFRRLIRKREKKNGTTKE